MISEELFHSTVVSIFDTCFRKLGAVPAEAETPGVVRYVADEWFVEVYRLLEDAPRFCPLVDIGPRPEVRFLEGYRSVDISLTIPESMNELRYYMWNWRYESATQMEDAFRRIRDEIFLVYAAPTLRRAPLQDLVRRRAEQEQRRWNERIQEHNDAVYRSLATEAWQSRDYLNFIANLSKIPAETLCRSEQLKLAYAKRKALVGE